MEKGYCKCGCKGRTHIIKYDNKSRGWVKGEYTNYIKGHHRGREHGVPLSIEILKKRQVISKQLYIEKLRKKGLLQEYRRKHRHPEQAKRWRSKKENKIKMFCHHKVEVAILKGILIRQPCEFCPRADTHAHHDDYSEPLRVRWLCPLHHVMVHKRVNL